MCLSALLDFSVEMRSRHACNILTLEALELRLERPFNNRGFETGPAKPHPRFQKFGRTVVFKTGRSCHVIFCGHRTIGFESRVAEQGVAEYN